MESLSIAIISIKEYQTLPTVALMFRQSSFSKQYSSRSNQALTPINICCSNTQHLYLSIPLVMRNDDDIPRCCCCNCCCCLVSCWFAGEKAPGTSSEGFFQEQLMAFEAWLQSAGEATATASMRRMLQHQQTDHQQPLVPPPEQVPVILQALLSPVGFA